MLSEHVIAMDPGGRSGWASAYMGTNRLEFTGSGVLRQDLLARWFAEQQAIHGPLTTYDRRNDVARFDVMVYESWYPREKDGSMAWIKGDPLLSAQHVGQLRLIADLSGARQVVQHPSDKPMAVTTMPAAFHDLDRFSNEQHDQDARQHLWLYFYRNWLDLSAFKPSTTTRNALDAVIVT